MKKAYKELRKKLKDVFVNQYSNNYSIVAGVGDWLKQCNIKPSEDKLRIIYNIFGSIPYPYQQKDRLVIIEYLSKNKFKVYKDVFTKNKSSKSKN